MSKQWIKNIDIENYRNIEKANLDFSPNINIIFGENAQGKTNLIEAVWLLSGGKSFRGTKDRDMIGFDKDGFRIEGNIFDEDRDLKITVSCHKKSVKFTTRMAKIDNGNFVSPSQIAGNFYCVIFSPVHLNIIGGGPSLRRKFVDACLCQIFPGFMDNYRQYNHILNQRNIFLKNIKKYDIRQQNAIFDSFDLSLSAYGYKIYTQRKEFCMLLSDYAADYYSKISSGREKLKIIYKNAGESIEDILEKLVKNRERDKILGHTATGVHREDIEIFLDDLPAKDYASQGQQRSVVIALKLAESQIMEAHTGVQPAVLLDDVLSELDFGRQDYLLNNVKDRQIFITSCDVDRIKLSNSKKFYVEGGKITECM